MRIAKVIKAQCAVTNQYFGIRIEQKLPGLWELTWAFPIKENMQITETYQDRVEGKFVNAATYPGCPYCHQKGVVLNTCKKISCINYNQHSHKCPWCGLDLTINDHIVVMIFQ